MYSTGTLHSGYRFQRNSMKRKNILEKYCTKRKYIIHRVSSESFTIDILSIREFSDVSVRRNVNVSVCFTPLQCQLHESDNEFEGGRGEGLMLS